ncbi:MAG: ChaN family lipoprotein [Elusimicrobia bacterium]|nr:ChaN family lipoprotein [Elusimicrobiota bacterium]
MAILTASLAACLAVASASSAQAQTVPDFDRIAPTTADWLGAIRRLPAPVGPSAARDFGEERVVVASEGAAVVGWDALGQALSQAAVVYVGEQHDQALHHALQLEVLKEVHGRAGRVTVGFEMVDRTQQKVLDDYAAGLLAEAEFALWWQKAWGFPFELYRPLFVYAKENGLPLKALNAPSSVIRNIARQGLASLSPEERRLLPARVDPIAEPRYLAYVKKTINGHGQLDPAREARMLEAMAAWNETMGQSVVDILADGAGPVVVIAGMGHMLYGAGIGESVARRSQARQVGVLPYPLDDSSRPLPELLKELQDPASEDISLADYFRLLPR